MNKVAVAALLITAINVNAQPYPAKPILVISPVQAGSAGDTTLRIVTQKMAQNMGQTLLVENTTGAAGLIGAQRAARATPDGYTIAGISDSTVTYVPILQKRADFEPFQPLNVLDPVSLVSSSTWVLIAHPSMPAKSVSELVALVKSQSQKFKKIDYAYAGDVLRARRGAEAAARATPARAGRGQCTTHTVVAANPHHC